MFTRTWRVPVREKSVYQIPAPRDELLGYSVFAAKTLRYLIRDRFDVVHGNGFEGEVVSFLARTLLRTHTVLTIHIDPIRPGRWFQYWRHRASFFLKDQAIRAASRVIVPSRYLLQNLRVRFPGLNPSQVVYIPHGVDVSEFNPSARCTSGLLRREMGLEHKKVLLYVGRIDPDKGLDGIIEAYRKVKSGRHSNIVLVIAGGKSKTAYRKSLETVNPDVIFLGEVPHDRTPQIYASADLYCIYSNPRFEVSSLTIMEALSSGLPVVCSDIPAFREVTRGNAVFVRPGEPIELARAIESLLDSPDLLRILSTRSRAVAEKCYSWNRTFEETEQTYYDLLS